MQEEESGSEDLEKELASEDENMFGAKKASAINQDIQEDVGDRPR